MRHAFLSTCVVLLVLATSCGQATPTEPAYGNQAIHDSQSAISEPQDLPLAEESEITSRRVEKTSSTASPETSPTELEATLVAHAATQIVEARQRPESQAELIATFANPTARGGPLVFQALGPPANGWIEVLLPLRPNGTTGWIPLAQIELSRNPYRIDIDVDQFTLEVSRYGEPVVSTTIGIGDTDTPTPLGDFYLVELLRPPDPNGAYGSYAYGLSGFSEVLSEFSGGEAVIGIHGTNRPDLLGQHVSFGCIRVENAVIEELASFLPLGTPVSIVP